MTIDPPDRIALLLSKADEAIRLLERIEAAVKARKGAKANMLAMAKSLEGWRDIRGAGYSSLDAIAEALRRTAEGL